MKSARPSRQTRAPRGPFHHPFDVRSLKGAARDVEFVATPEQCATIARSVGLPDVASLKASFHLTPHAGDRVELDGRVRATVTQTCVVSLEPFESAVDQAVELSFAPAAEPIVEPRGRGGRGNRGDGGDRDLAEFAMPAPVGGNDDQEDPPDPIVDDVIDLGAVAVEFMVIGLDPYPRKPGVHFDDMVVGDKDEPAPSAFAALARLKDSS